MQFENFPNVLNISELSILCEQKKWANEKQIR